MFMTTEVHYKENLITMNLIIIFTIQPEVLSPRIGKYILGDPGAATCSRDGAIFSGESLFEGQKSPWELTLTEPVPEIFEFVPLIGQKDIFHPKILHQPD